MIEILTITKIGITQQGYGGGRSMRMMHIKNVFVLTLSCSKDVQILIDRILLWKPNTMQDFTEEHEKYLHAEGEKEMVLMAERYADRFPSLLKGHYHPELFKFRSTYTQR
jgi:hypothetical protein